MNFKYLSYVCGTGFTLTLLGLGASYFKNGELEKKIYGIEQSSKASPIEDLAGSEETVLATYGGEEYEIIDPRIIDALYTKDILYTKIKNKRSGVVVKLGFKTNKFETHINVYHPINISIEDGEPGFKKDGKIDWFTVDSTNYVRCPLDHFGASEDCSCNWREGWGERVGDDKQTDCTEAKKQGDRMQELYQKYFALLEPVYRKLKPNNPIPNLDNL